MKMYGILTATVSLVVLAFVSCGNTVEDMVENYNETLATVSEDGTLYTENGKDYELSTLIPYARYTVEKGYMADKIQAARGYKSYKWTMTDSAGSAVTGFTDTSSFVRLNTQRLKLEVGDYTLQVVATNHYDNTYRDSTVLAVVEPE